jgi:hypothetical protein
MNDRRFPSPAADDLAPALAQALARLCETEGVALAQVRSIAVDDGEISVRIERPGRGCRIVTYPVAVLLADPTRSWSARTGNSSLARSLGIEQPQLKIEKPAETDECQPDSNASE